MAAEQKIEQHLKRRVTTLGGVCWKLAATSTAGVPDRIVVMPGGRVIFIELKAPGKKPRPLQQRRLAQLDQLGAETYVIDNHEQVEQVLAR